MFARQSAGGYKAIVGRVTSLTLATLLLVILTGRYVILTKRQLDAGERRERDNLQMIRFHVREYVWHLGERLQDPYIDGSDITSLYAVRIWTDADLDRLRTLVEESREFRVGIAADAIEDLRRIGRRLAEVRSRGDQLWVDSAVLEWEAMLNNAQQKLDALIG